MTTNIEKMRFDMAETQRGWQQQYDARRAEWDRKLKWWTLKWGVGIVFSFAAAFGIGFSIGYLILTHPEPLASPPQQVIIFPPGTVITLPAAPAPAK